MVTKRPTTTDPRRILLLADDHPGHANTVLDHIDAFRSFSRFDVHVFNPRGLARSAFLRLDRYDAIVVHYSLLVISDAYLAPAFREAIHAYRGLKVQFIQDEYRWIDEITDMMEYLGIDLVFSAAAEEDLPALYTNRLPRTRAVTTLTGYMPDSLLGLSAPPLAERPIDVGYRGRVVPFALGELGQEKVRIAKGFLERASGTGLRCDIGWREDERIYGPAWNTFIMSLRAMLGTESGASIADFDGSLDRQVNAYLGESPDATFEEVWERILRPFEGNLRIQTVSPRVFESIALRTPMIQYPGRYSGVLEPDEHYIVLEKDFSNFDEVVERVRDLPALEAMTARAYRDVASSGAYSYRAFAASFDREVEALLGTASFRSPSGGGVAVRLRDLDRDRRLRAAEWQRASRLGGASAGPGAAGAGLAALPERLQHAARLKLARAEILIRPRALGTQVLAESRPWRLARELAWLTILLRFAARQPTTRRLLAAIVRGGRIHGISRRALVGEVIRLAVLTEAAGDPGRAGFGLSCAYDCEDAQLRLTSVPVGDEAASGVDWDALAAAVHDPSGVSLVWSHAAVGEAYSCAFALGKRLRRYVGREYPSIHRFDEIQRFAAARPEVVLDVLRALAPGVRDAQGTPAGVDR